MIFLIQLDVNFIIKFHFYNFIMTVVTYFYIEYRENKNVSGFSTISVSIINYINLTLKNHVENIKFFIQFHFINNFIRRFFCQRVCKSIQNFMKLYENLIF